MRALLLAAGMGTRLRPLTDRIPKCLVPIHDKPLLDYWLELLLAGGIERVLINTHWLAETVEVHVSSSRWKSHVDIVREPELLGTGGTIHANRAYFCGKPLLVAHADNLTDFDLSAMLEVHARRPAGAVMTMLAFRTDDPSSCGILEVDARGLVRGFHEKVAEPPGNLANGAVYVLEPEIVEYIAGLGRSFVDLSTEVIPEFVDRIAVFETSGYHRDIGNPESLRRAHLEFSPAGSVICGIDPQAISATGSKGFQQGSLLR